MGPLHFLENARRFCACVIVAACALAHAVGPPCGCLEAQADRIVNQRGVLDEQRADVLGRGLAGEDCVGEAAEVTLE